MSIDPTDRGYDEATATNDGRDQIPHASNVVEDTDGPAEGPTDDNPLDDIHNSDELVDLARQPKPDPREANEIDNQAEWSRQDA